MSLPPEWQFCRPGTGAEELGLELFDEFVSISAKEIISGKGTVHTSIGQNAILHFIYANNSRREQ